MCKPHITQIKCPNDTLTAFISYVLHAVLDLSIFSEIKPDQVDCYQVPHTLPALGKEKYLII